MNSTEKTPVRIVVDFLPGVAPKDAESFARGFIRRHGYSISRAAYRVTRYPGGCAYEIHEGGAQRALLPGILKHLELAEEVHVVTGTRVLRVQKTRSGYQALLLPEGQAAECMPIKPGPRLKPYQNLHVGLINFAAALLSVSIIAFGATLGAFVLLGNAEQHQVVDGTAQKVTQLPIERFPAMREGYFVEEHRFRGGRWEQPVYVQPEEAVIAEVLETVGDEVRSALDEAVTAGVVDAPGVRESRPGSRTQARAETQSAGTGDRGDGNAEPEEMLPAHLRVARSQILGGARALTRAIQRHESEGGEALSAGADLRELVSARAIAALPGVPRSVVASGGQWTLGEDGALLLPITERALCQALAIEGGAARIGERVAANRTLQCIQRQGETVFTVRYHEAGGA